MLRRKLLLVLGSLIVLLLVAALSAILLLHDVLQDLNHASSEVVTGTTRTRLVEQAVSALEADLYRLRGRPEASPDSALVAAAALDQRTEELFAPGIVPPEAAAGYRRIRALVPELNGHLNEYAGAEDEAARAESPRMHRQVVEKFRGAAIVLGIGFLVLLNASIIVVLRAAIMVLKPVGKLVEASRRLGREEFDHRIDADRTDEFGELAQAYNSLAEQLQTNEQRKVETLHQVACTLNHELNNAISTIELQLTVVGRRQGRDQTLAQPLRQIHQTLGRMSDTIDALKRVRKIVLTDYLSGVKMLDLERSVAEDSPSGQPSPPATAEIKHP
jgi:HAMP domain-containing protein